MRHFVRPGNMLFAALLVLASCDAADNTMFEPTRTLQVEFHDDSMPVTVPGDNGNEYTLVEAEIKFLKLSASKWIGKDGGYLTLEGTSRDGLKKIVHMLVIPDGAVQHRTLFTMTVSSSHLIQVELRAQIERRIKGDRVLVDVGQNGFRTPVMLALDHSLANVADPKRLRLLYDPENGQPWQDMGGFVFNGYENWIVSYLPHFSKYAVALD